MNNPPGSNTLRHGLRGALLRGLAPDVTLDEHEDFVDEGVPDRGEEPEVGSENGAKLASPPTVQWRPGRRRSGFR